MSTEVEVTTKQQPAILRHADRALRILERGGVTLAGAGFGALALLLLIDMIRRRLFNETFVWLEDFTSLYLLSAGYFLSLAYTHRINAHIYVDVISSHLSERSRRAMRLLGELAGITLFALIFYAGLRLTGDEFTHHRHGVVTLTWPTWTYYVLVPIGAGLAALRSLLNLFLVPFTDPSDSETAAGAAAAESI